MERITREWHRSHHICTKICHSHVTASKSYILSVFLFKFYSWKRNVIQNYCCSPQSSAQNWAYSRPDWTRLSWCYRRCIGPGGRCDRWLAEKVAAPTALWRLSTNQRQAVKMRRDESGCFSHFSGRQLPLPFFFFSCTVHTGPGLSLTVIVSLIWDSKTLVIL